MYGVRTGPRLARGLFLAALLSGGSAFAAPWRPTDDGQVLERLPTGSPRAATAVAPGDPARAAALARGYIEQSRREGDPRFLGYAEGVLRPWWTQAAPPEPVLLLRATLLQSRHHFAESLRDLDALLAANPRNGQALLTRATVLRVQGRYAEAEASCAALDPIASAFVTDLCIASVRSLNGQLAGMASALDAMEADSRSQPPALQAWFHAERGDMAERLGKDAEALQHYRAALAANPDDPLVRAAAADVLLRLHRPAEVLQLTGDAPLADVLRLRVALARRALGSPDPALEAALADSYAASRRRGEDVHLREEARYTLEVLGDAPRALELARQNWATQREPADARVLAAAEHAATAP